MMMAAHKGWQRAIARLAVLAIAVQAVLGALMLPMSGTGISAAGAASAGFTICTTDGFLPEPAGADPGQSMPARHQNAQDCCTLCALLTVSGAALAPGAQTLPSGVLASVTGIPSGNEQPPAVAHSTQRNRGPPSKA
jgi:hypothetical protein